MDSNDLKRLGLTNVNIFDLFRLDPNGKSSAQLLGFSSSDNQKALKLIRKQYCDIVHLYRARDDDNEAILNSAMAFLEHDTVSRWAELVARPPPDPPDPERCPSPMPASINNHEQDNAVEKSGSLPPNGDMKCPKCNEGPFKTVRRLAGHAMKCPKNSEAPKAKPSSQACVYGCGYVKSNYSAHEAFDHYRCTCGRVVTAKHKDCTGKKTKINPAEYFFGLPLGYLAPKPKPEDILDRAFWNLPQGDIDVLVSLDRDAFTSMAFNAISKRRHHSLEPASIKTTGDAAESTANSCGTSVDQNILDMPSYPASQNGKSRDIRRSPQYCPRGGLNASKGSVDAKPITERFRNAGTRCQPTTQNSPPRISDPEVEVRSAVSVHQPNLFPQAYFDDVTLDLYNYCSCE
ncbi:hypothetical protein B0I35DRAFT_178282 [Stachybotrys elegans]|uniref:Uncharacterized protein n=1 Tax=Stachybotrys elegans TaxID=80388 RepID=A0A8K0SHD4_9HYPO|nr:hypothetical protein B0I35DRAFT_178282 [Stachybotrys elegans]